jgi:hypothetical protein
MSRDSVPRTNAEVAAWALHLAGKIDTHAPALALAADEVAALKADAAMIDWSIKAAASLRASTQQFTAFKEALLDGPIGTAPSAVPAAPTLAKAPAAVPTGAIPRTRALAQRIKKAVAYTEAIGLDLGIVASGADLAAGGSAKPTFRATALAHSENRLDWVKGPHSGVVIQGRRPGENDWSDLGRDNYSPYVDGRPPLAAGASETREYRMRYLDKDTEVGEWSDVVSVVTIP